MEALLQNLEKQQIQLQQQQLLIEDLRNMENISDRKAAMVPPRKYVSVFRIDGEPILPPLMTAEKRRQMQKLKENALKIEKSLNECKQRIDSESYQNTEDTKNEISCSPLHQTASTISQGSHDSYETKLCKETEESMDLLKNLIERQEEEEVTHKNSMESEQTACNTSSQFPKDESKKKLQKLQKSEILIYDNSTNEVIQLPAESEMKGNKGQRKQSREMEFKANFSYVPNKQPSHLLLAGNNKGMTAIPSICLNPPTPLMGKRNLCESLNSTENSENSFDYNLDSSDESFNSMVTQSDKKPNRNIRHNIAPLVKKTEKPKDMGMRGHTQAKNVCAKIKQFEAILSDSNTPQTSPEKVRTCLRESAGSINRSATSPSIKLGASNRSTPRSQSFGQELNRSADSSLIRSSSFTLEGPSKALIEHMQQQKVISDKKVATKSPLNTRKKTLFSPLRAYRDTVESKAKKVQKVELKSSRQKTLQKSSQSKVAHSFTVSNLPYSSIVPFPHSSNMCKTNKSPYEISRTSHTSLNTVPKASSTHMRRSSSTSSNLIQSKTSKARLVASTSKSSSSSKTPLTGKESLTQIEEKQNVKFLQLLAQQEEEHQRLQKSFEIQQQMLIEQLSQEINSSKLKSPNNSFYPSAVTSTSQQKRFDQQNVLSPQQAQPTQPQLQSQSHASQSQPPAPPLPPKPLTLTGFTVDHGFEKSSSALYDMKYYSAHLRQRQSSPSSISCNSSQISVDKSLSQTLNPLHASPNTQFPQPTQINFHSSLTDHSNANTTSLDISTPSTQTSPDTPTTHLNAAENGIGNQSNPSTRRRLFSSEMNAACIDGKTLKTRSPYTSGKRAQQPQKLDQANKSVTPTTNDSDRRSPADIFILHAAATKINAYARGFLVRRLFQTEQVQRVVQTIRDTLIFVLTLHIETIENHEESQTPANIKLKARLLQQLSSACRTLHFLFFQTSIKERMEMIARDRKRIKTKLMSMSRKKIS